MPTTTTTTSSSSDWTPERLDRLCRALLPLVFPGRPTPAPGPANVVSLASYRQRQSPRPDALLHPK
jgi:hypothetical protein